MTQGEQTRGLRRPRLIGVQSASHKSSIVWQVVVEVVIHEVAELIRNVLVWRRHHGEMHQMKSLSPYSVAVAGADRVLAIDSKERAPEQLLIPHAWRAVSWFPSLADNGAMVSP